VASDVQVGEASMALMSAPVALPLLAPLTQQGVRATVAPWTLAVGPPTAVDVTRAVARWVPAVCPRRETQRQFGP